MHTTNQLLTRMFSQADVWEKKGDQRYIFQRCYGMMSSNMALAIEGGRFSDAQWVEQLMRRFAEYYFEAVELYDRGHADTPAVWQQVHDAAQKNACTYCNTFCSASMRTSTMICLWRCTMACTPNGRHWKR